jgi:phage terminase large subunit-like protein
VGLRSERNIAWIETYCRVPEGKHVGKPVKLSKAQRKWMSEIYDSPTRLIILSFGRKNGKTSFSAFLLLLHLCGPEAKLNSQLFSAAQSRDQAALLFGLASKMVRLNPDLAASVVIRDTKKELFCPDLGTVYRALSAEASTAYGLSPAFTVHDELGQVKGPRSELFEALETASAAQESPLSIVISTQAPTDGDLLSTLIDDALTGADPTRKAVVYSAPLEDDPFAVETIRKANPHFDSFMNQAEVIRMAEEAKRMPSREASYRNLILNQRVEARRTFITRAVWETCADIPEIEDGAEVFAGLDLSSVNDLTALVLISHREGKWDVLPTFWLPREGIHEKSRADRVPYDLWAEQGYLTLTPGRSIEYEYVAEHLRDVFDRYRVKALAFDRWNMRHFRPWLERVGFSEEDFAEDGVFKNFGQGYQSMSPALRELESLLLNAKIRHGNHPVLNMCAANATVDSDPAGNRKLSKAKSSGRIDGMVALAMAVGVTPDAAEIEAPEYQIFFV